jgi:hypothetical protein
MDFYRTKKNEATNTRLRGAMSKVLSPSGIDPKKIPLTLVPIFSGFDTRCQMDDNVHPRQGVSPIGVWPNVSDHFDRYPA